MVLLSRKTKGIHHLKLTLSRNLWVEDEKLFMLTHVTNWPCKQSSSQWLKPLWNKSAQVGVKRQEINNLALKCITEVKLEGLISLQELTSLANHTQMHCTSPVHWREKQRVGWARVNTSIRLHPFSPPTTSWSLVKTNKNTKKHLLTAILRSHHTRVHERNHVVSCWNHYGACAACTYSQWELHITGNLDYKMPFYYLGRVQIDSLPILCIIVCNTTNCWSDLKVAWLLCLVLATGLYVRRLHVGPNLWCNTCCVPAYLLYASYYIKTSKLWIKNIKPLKYVSICLFLYFVLFVSPVCHVSPYPWSQCHVHVS